MKDLPGGTGMAQKTGSAGKILFVVVDHLRADVLNGRLAEAARLPNLRALMSEAVTFLNHFSVTTPCGPARASLLTGLYAMNHRSVRNGTPLAAHHTNLALELRKCGREPLLFGYTDTSPDPGTKHPADPDLKSYEGLMPGFKEILEMRFETSLPWLVDLAGKGYDVSNYRALVGAGSPDGSDGLGRQAAYRAEDSDTAFLTNATLGHLETRRDQDWVAHLTYIRPHPPFIAPEPWNSLVSANEVPGAVAASDPTGERALHPLFEALLSEPRARSLFPGFDGDLAGMSEAVRQRLRAIYLGLSAEVDHHLGRIFDWLKATGQWDETLIVVTGDHGEMLGDHFHWGKDTPFDATFHVPLIIRDPQNADAFGASVDKITESIDVAPTILDWACGSSPPAFDGRSLMPFLRGERPSDWRDHAFMEMEFGEPVTPTLLQRRLDLPLRAANAAILREKRWKYIHFNGGLPPLLFDIEADPAETRNLAGDPDCREDLMRLSRKMLDHRMSHAFGALSSTAITPKGVVRE
jgi:arylsulfatase A-like enzyme